ncbi:MAG: Yip1 family protein [Candidatus Saganbacteria bacterium]|nr:Yip1 family protein [Candidatus Saganbacteria bacterium]
MNFSLLVSKIRKLLLLPNDTWKEIKFESTSVSDLFRSYAVYIAAVPCLVAILRYGIIGIYDPFQGLIRVSFINILFFAVVKLGANLLAIYAMAKLTTYLAYCFDSKVEFTPALKLVVYAVTPFWLADVFLLIPFLRIFTILGWYSVYLFYVGLPIILETSQEKVIIFVFSAVCMAVVLMFGTELLVRQFAPLPAYLRFS